MKNDRTLLYQLFNKQQQKMIHRKDLSDKLDYMGLDLGAG